MQDDLIRKYAGPAPRYTSYPAAPHFHDGISGDDYARWLAGLPAGSTLSLYVHIPWCDRLCWFCGCHTRQTLRYDPLKTYLAALDNEIATVASLVNPDVRVTALHLGGGSPTMLKPEDIVALNGMIRSRFRFAARAEISVEMDPNDLTAEKFDALAEIGLTRASIGVQDFDEKVQQAINRIQTFEQTRHVIDEVRRRGVRSVNCDVLYGLPHQTCRSVERTIEQVVSLAPDRLALFGYAHVPWMKTHQKMIDENALPGIAERYAQMAHASHLLTSHGYAAIGIDHFARSTDSLAVAARSGRLRRNFQGYTADGADALIGLGASSIGQFPQGYIQNEASTGQYMRTVNAGRLAVARGFELSADDRARARVIERLMCDFSFSTAAILTEFGEAATSVLDDAERLVRSRRDGLVAFNGEVFEVTSKGRPFVRSVAAAFDAYLGKGKARHSLAV